MIRKILTVLLGVALLLPGLPAARAMEKSVEAINDTDSVSNSGPRIIIPHGEGTAEVYYGKTGINIISDQGRQHLETNFEVLKLADGGDVNGDGFTDFITYQNAPDFSAQVMTISGKDGSVISTTQFSRESYNDSLGFFKTNSYITEIVKISGNRAAIINDYSVSVIDLASGEVLFAYTAGDNIWHLVEIGDVDGDGTNDLAFTGQQNLVGLVSGADGSLIREYHPSEVYHLNARWNEGLKFDAEMNMWDARYLDGLLYVTSEDGRIHVIDPAGVEVTSYALEAVNQEFLLSIFSERMEWDFRGVERVNYAKVGVTDWTYYGYRIADVTDQYLLINCYMGSLNGISDYPITTFLPATLLFNRETGTVDARLFYDSFSSLYLSNCFGEYEGQPCIANIIFASEGMAKLGVYSLTGELLAQKDIRTDLIKGSQKMILTWDGEKYTLELLNAGCLNISGDLKDVSFCYDAVSSVLLDTFDDGLVIMYSLNGVKNRLVKYSPDLSEILWDYTYAPDYPNKGFEDIRSDLDFNNDGIRDIFALINRYDKDDNIYATYYLVLNGNGSVIKNTAVITDTYWDKGVKHTVYLTAQKIGLVRDYDGDGVKELLMDSNVISSRKNQVMGSLSGYLDAKGTPFDIGDANHDGVTDYAVFNGSEIRNYYSSVKMSYGYLNVTYYKTSISSWIDTGLDPVNTSVTLDDMNNDGAKELGLISRNNEGREIYRILDGATLKTICTLFNEGINDDGEAVAVLPYDLNGDGVNELFGRDRYEPGIYNGATGELMLSVKGYYYPGEEMYYGQEYYPDYLVPFWKLEEEPTFIIIDDVNGDESMDVVFPRITYDEYYNQHLDIVVYNGADQQLIKAIPADMDDRYGAGTIRKVNGSDEYFLIVSEASSGIVDINSLQMLANYDISIKNASRLSDEIVLAESKDGLLYRLSTVKSFEVTSEIPEETDSSQLHLSWKSIQDYSVMTITDNGTVVYSGEDSQAVIQLMEGEHTIMLSMNDGVGKTCSESHAVTVGHQPKNVTGVLAGAIAALILAFLGGIFQKIMIRSKFKKEVAK